jgi:uncharacterized protein
MNLLSKETSPYLLQHANNPVNWVAWNEESLAKALSEDKPIIVSIGYSACHWCHVMEHESFENEAVAAIMNEYFICIKVDREERPDVDGIYMEAVQAMGIHGGWPLNVFLMPDGKPFYGGTYFPPNKWAGICQNIAEAFVGNREELKKSAEGFTQNILVSEADKYGLNASEIQFKDNDFNLIINGLVEKSDPIWGGLNKAPKFPMPSIWLFMLDYLKNSKFKKNENLKHFESTETQLKVTLDRMAFGGIYDQIGGGFSRYSVDGEWFCPHFEKMLYDNAQLLSIYSKAYSEFGTELYKEIIYQTIGWLKREMLTNDGAFYSAQDADSEGVEGKFYIWTKHEIQNILGEKSDEFCIAFQITDEGNWENGENILWKNKYFLNSKFEKEIKILLEIRNKRVFPGLDDKILCAWNGLLISGLVDSYKAFSNEEFLQLAINCGEFIKNNFYKNGKLLRTYKNGEAKIDGFLEDYAAVISAFTALYQATFNENWLSLAETLMITCLDDFFDESDQFFNFSNRKSQQLIANKKELFDNVIPCSNSIIAHNLYDLGVLLSRNDFLELSKTMVQKMRKLILSNGDYLSNWANLALKQSQPKIEIVIYGPRIMDLKKGIQKYNLPNYFILCSENESNLPLFEHRKPPEHKTFIYVCINNTCSLPVENVEEAVEIVLKSLA